MVQNRWTQNQGVLACARILIEEYQFQALNEDEDADLYPLPKLKSSGFKRSVGPAGFDDARTLKKEKYSAPKFDFTISEERETEIDIDAVSRLNFSSKDSSIILSM